MGKVQEGISDILDILWPVAEWVADAWESFAQWVVKWVKDVWVLWADTIVNVADIIWDAWAYWADVLTWSVAEAWNRLLDTKLLKWTELSDKEWFLDEFNRRADKASERFTKAADKLILEDMDQFKWLEWTWVDTWIQFIASLWVPAATLNKVAKVPWALNQMAKVKNAKQAESLLSNIAKKETWLKDTLKRLKDSGTTALWSKLTKQAAWWATKDLKELQKVLAWMQKKWVIKLKDPSKWFIKWNVDWSTKLTKVIDKTLSAAGKPFGLAKKHPFITWTAWLAWLWALQQSKQDDTRPLVWTEWTEIKKDDKPSERKLIWSDGQPLDKRMLRLSPSDIELDWTVEWQPAFFDPKKREIYSVKKWKKVPLASNINDAQEASEEFQRNNLWTYKMKYIEFNK